MSACLNRIQEERRNWRKNHPLGFHAKPMKAADGSLDLTRWTMGIPGKKNTVWEGGVYPVTITFPPEYPKQAPLCRFPPGFYHANVYPTGSICLSLLQWDYRPSTTLREIALGLQALLAEPNPTACPAAQDWYRDKRIYDRKVRECVERYRV